MGCLSFSQPSCGLMLSAEWQSTPKIKASQDLQYPENSVVVSACTPLSWYWAYRSGGIAPDAYFYSNVNMKVMEAQGNGPPDDVVFQDEGSFYDPDDQAGGPSP